MGELEVHLAAALRTRRSAIVDRWRERAVEVYGAGAARLLDRSRDRFQNPVGYVTDECLVALFENVLAGRPAEDSRELVDGIVRIRAVQDLSPSQAVGFIFQLKLALREELGEAATSEISWADLSALYARIDALALQAFDLFVQCREQIYDLRAREISRRTSNLLERLQKQDPEDQNRLAGGGSGGSGKGGRGA